ISSIFWFLGRTDFEVPRHEQVNKSFSQSRRAAKKKRNSHRCGLSEKPLRVLRILPSRTLRLRFHRNKRKGFTKVPLLQHRKWKSSLRHEFKTFQPFNSSTS